MRALPFDFRTDPQAARVTDQFMVWRTLCHTATLGVLRRSSQILESACNIARATPFPVDARATCDSKRPTLF